MTITYNADKPLYINPFFGGERLAHSHDTSTNEVRRLAALPRGRESTIAKIEETIAKVTHCSGLLAITPRGYSINNYLIGHQLRLDEGLITNLNNLLIEKIIVLPPIH